MRVVLTGATGTIGINFLRYLLNEKITVLAIVREKRKIQQFLKDSNLKVIECSLNELNTIKIPDEKYDIFYHIAWEGTRGEDRNDIEKQIKNLQYTLDTLKLAEKLRCHTFIGTGSQAEYGPTNEKINKNTYIAPDTAYGIAKLCAGQISRLMANQIGIKHIWTRILSIYGPYDYPNSMIMSTIREMIEKHQAPPYTKAEQVWDFLYVEDMSRALYSIGEKGKNNAIYCVGSGIRQTSL